MADQSRHPDTGGDTGVRRDREGLPRWVKASAIIVAIVVLVIAVLLLTGVFSGEHSPGRHF
jgi:hypothetical protein